MRLGSNRELSLEFYPGPPSGAKSKTKTILAKRGKIGKYQYCFAIARIVFVLDLAPGSRTRIAIPRVPRRMKIPGLGNKMRRGGQRGLRFGPCYSPSRVFLLAPGRNRDREETAQFARFTV